MGYYIRVLGKKIVDIPVEELRKAAAPATIEVAAEEDSGKWSELVLQHADGTEIAVIERNDVVEGELGAEELQEFIESVASYKPDSAVAWLQSYLPNVKVIYAFQLLSGTDVQDGWTLLHSVYSKVWHATGGILQADVEGFSNEAGFTILWQFSKGVTGEWQAGVLGKDGKWIHFKMDLGNTEHREAFQRGEVPRGAKLI